MRTASAGRVHGPGPHIRGQSPALEKLIEETNRSLHQPRLRRNFESPLLRLPLNRAASRFSGSETVVEDCSPLCSTSPTLTAAGDPDRSTTEPSLS